METPELLLKGLNASLRDLHAAIPLIDDSNLGQAMVPIMRRLLLAEVLGNKAVLGIGGSQGAGKTTLLRSMYGAECNISDWLKPNEGRGECMPILVVEESGRTSAQGAVWKLKKNGDGFEAAAEDLDSPDLFTNATVSPDPDQLLPVLKVPRRYFEQPNQAWLLLPGYEQEDVKNREWQHLMRQGLVGAAGCIIVTDETRLATDEQARIVADMRANELRGSQVMVVISKTERKRASPEALHVLRQTARRVFEMPEALDDRWVICTGSDDPDYTAQWLPCFEATVKDLARSGGGDRLVRHARLAEVVRGDLAKLMARIDTKASLHFHAKRTSVGGEVVQLCLDAFDDKVGELRSDYARNIGKMLDKHNKDAWNHLQTLMTNDHEGIKASFVEFFRKATASWKRVEDDVLASWDKPGPVMAAYAGALGQITQRELQGPKLQASTDELPKLPQEGSSAQRLGYVVDGSAQPWQRPTTTEMQNLALLFGTLTTTAAPDTSAVRRMERDFERSVKLLPVLALEYVRAASLAPAIVGVDPDNQTQVELSDRPDLIRNGVQDLGKGVALGSTVLRSVAAILTLDFAADGSIDLPAALTTIVTGGASTGAGGAAAAGAVSIGSAVVATVAVGYLFHSAIRETKLHDQKARRVFQMLLQNVRDHYQAHFMESYDELMRQMRARLSDALRERYHLDQELMEKDRIAKALADVRSHSRDFLDELGRSGVTLMMDTEDQSA
ncbi:hypothetical protein [Stenotrophomonas sp.]|uniref:hypothetical protein n=1 Tax=Stenotrophomonas sp. TaxID=69392 RepID=UPI00289B4C29|nr:hypothetical protein [Stenotrophomonas sp.]